MTTTTYSPAAGAQRPPRGGPARIRAPAAYLGALPFLVYVGVFLLYPTLIVVLGAFQHDARQPAPGNLPALGGAVSLAACGGAGAGAVLPGRGPAAVRQRLLRIRDRGRAGLTGQPDRAVGDPGLPHQ